MIRPALVAVHLKPTRVGGRRGNDVILLHRTSAGLRPTGFTVRQRTDRISAIGDAWSVIKQRPRLFPRYPALLALAAGLGGSLCLQAGAESFEVPALSSPSNDTHLVGKVIWLDLETTDLPGAKRFYHALFGWDYRDYHADGVAYTVALANGNPVAGLVRRQIGNR